MSRTYFDRYEYFINENSFSIVPGLEIPVKGTDKFIIYKKGSTRLDKVSQDYYSTPVFSWLILLANPHVGSIEFEIPDNSRIRIPFPLVTSLQDYKRSVELYKLYYGED